MYCESDEYEFFWNRFRCFFYFCSLWYVRHSYLLRISYRRNWFRIERSPKLNEKRLQVRFRDVLRESCKTHSHFLWEYIISKLLKRRWEVKYLLGREFPRRRVLLHSFWPSALRDPLPFADSTLHQMKQCFDCKSYTTLMQTSHEDPSTAGLNFERKLEALQARNKRKQSYFSPSAFLLFLRRTCTASARIRFRFIGNACNANRVAVASCTYSTPRIGTCFSIAARIPEETSESHNRFEHCRMRRNARRAARESCGAVLKRRLKSIFSKHFSPAEKRVTVRKRGKEGRRSQESHRASSSSYHYCSCCDSKMIPSQSLSAAAEAERTLKPKWCSSTERAR